MSGNHKKIMAWRLEHSIERTRKNRPDLYEKYERKQQVIKRLSKKKRMNIHMMEFLNRGLGEILYEDGLNIVLKGQGLYEITAETREAAEKMLSGIREDMKICVVNREFLKDILVEQFGMECSEGYYQACYTKKEALPVKHKDIRRLDRSALEYACAHYANGSEAYITDRLKAGAMYGAFVDDRLVGFAGIHSDGSCGMLYVEEAYRGQGMGESLEAYVINRIKDNGYIPYGHVSMKNTASLHMQEKLGLYLSEGPIWWLRKG